ncbi:MAG: hypothetical protein ACUVUQ_11995 [Thermodesulfovibrionales bacterium]|uniref:hypothetical protein n=1 Tax=Candidatus Jordarchaeum sp. TaxID=2823881 RepID=UPI004048EDE6
MSQIDLFRRIITILEQKNKSKDALPLNEMAMEVLKARSKIRNIKSNLVIYSNKRTMIDASANLMRTLPLGVKKSSIPSSEMA